MLACYTPFALPPFRCTCQPTAGAFSVGLVLYGPGAVLSEVKELQKRSPNSLRWRMVDRASAVCLRW